MIKSFFKRLFQKSTATQIPLADSAARVFLQQPYTMAGRFGWSDVKAAAAWSYYKQVAPVRDAIDTGATNFKSVPFGVQNKEGDIYTEYDPRVPATEILKLLRKPNTDKNGMNLKVSAYSSYHATGETYFVATYTDIMNKPIELYWVMPQLVSITTDGQGRTLQYIVTSGENRDCYKRKELDDASIIYTNANEDRILYHMKNFNPDEECGDGSGLSPLSSLYFELESTSNISLNNNSLLRNGMRPGMAVTMQKPDEHFEGITQEQMDDMREGIMKMYAGPNNAGNVLILDGVDKVHEIAMNNREMQFKEMKEDDKLQIYRNLNIPLPLVNQDSQTYNNFHDAQEMFFDMNIIPYAEDYVANLNAFLMHSYDDSGDYRLVVLQDEIPLKKARKEKEVGSMKTLNERREAANLSELDTDFIEIGNQVIPMSGAMMQEEISEDKFIDVMMAKGWTQTRAKEQYKAIYGCNH